MNSMLNNPLQQTKRVKIFIISKADLPLKKG